MWLDPSTGSWNYALAYVQVWAEPGPFAKADISERWDVLTLYFRLLALTIDVMIVFTSAPLQDEEINITVFPFLAEPGHVDKADATDFLLALVCFILFAGYNAEVHWLLYDIKFFFYIRCL